MLDHTSSSSLAEDAPPAPETVRLQAQFHGRAGEYFRIWIVNLVLSILTLGIYSAWAKVRSERYFYGNTRVDGSAFEYLADPLRILKGRLIAYALVIVLVASQHFLPLLYLLLALALFLCMPLIVFLSLRFRARYSAWRGLRFRFVGSAGEAYGPFLGWNILSAITGSLLYPLMRRRQHQYMVDGHRFGSAAFRFHGDASGYYLPYLVALGAGVALMVLMVVAMVGLVVGAKVLGAEAGSAQQVVGSMIVVLMLAVYLSMFALMALVHTRYTNLLWSNARLQGGHRFECTLRVRDMLWIYVSNLFAILCTLGLATPWARVRLVHYRARHFAVLASGGVGGFMASVAGEQGAAGAELADALDIMGDIGF